MQSLLRLALLFLFCLTCSAQTYLTSPDFGSGAVTRSGLPPGAFGADPPRHFVLPGDDNLELASGFLPAIEGPQPPRQVNDLDFQMVWQSESHPYGMDKVAVGDLDNDGINELATWWKDSLYADTAYILIYKSSGDDQYILYMQEPVAMVESIPAVSYMLIDDLDQNGQKELIFTLMYCYFWEFSAPGVYHQWRSSFQFDFPVIDLKVTDVDRNNLKEITQLGHIQTPPERQSLMVEEFFLKNPADSTFLFYTLTDISWECESWFSYRPAMAVGDFDNDDTTDIVLGSGTFFGSFFADSLITYYRYAPNAPNYFILHQINPGIHAMGCNPLIADLDNDGSQELYAAGIGGYSLSSNGLGSAYVWEATGLDTGYVAWWDTTSMIYPPSGVAFAEIDSTPCVLNNIIHEADGQFCLFGFQNSQYQFMWQSQLFVNHYFTKPLSFFDIDQDGLMNFSIGEQIYPAIKRACDWEQTSDGITFKPVQEGPHYFSLYANYPNPFNSSTQISFELNRLSDIRLTIHDVSGRCVWEWLQKELNPGKHAYSWFAGDLPSGIYFITLHTAEAQQTQKAVLLK